MNEIQNIDTLTAEILILKQQTAQNIIEIGKRLISVKDSLPHGQWGKWLEEKVDFTQQTANKFMKVANEMGNYASMRNLGTAKIFALLSVPQEEREEFLKSNPVDDMTTRELQQAIKDREAALKEKQELENRFKSVSKDYEKLEKSSKTVSEQAEKLKKELGSIEDKNREELTNKEVEIENLRTFVDSMKNQIAQAQASGNDEEVERLQGELQENEIELENAKSRIEELEKQLKEKPIDVITAEPQIIEKIPEEVEKELQELRAKAGQKESKALSNFKVYFEGAKLNLTKILEVMEEIKESDEVTYEKCKRAFAALVDKMGQAV